MAKTDLKEQKNLEKKINPKKVIIPAGIGILAVFGMLFFQIKDKSINFNVIDFTATSFLFLFIAALFMMMRDIGYMIRFKILSENQVSWRQAFRVIMLWEFASAISPSAIGGTGVAVVFVHKEGISIGKSAAIVMATSFLDELYFIIMFPVMIFAVGPETLFTIGETSGLNFANQFFYFAVIGYTIKLAYNLFLSYGLFINPVVIKKTLLAIFSIKYLRRWRNDARRAGLDIISNSKELKKKPFSFWAKAIGATFLSWTSRYWVVNALFIAFFAMKSDHFLLFAKQLVMWVMMLVSPTPGGSGFSEYVFSEYLNDFMPQVAGIAIITAFVWRLFTYYPYLIAGVIIGPKWIRDKFNLKKKSQKTSLEEETIN
ncbi:MAG: flippase-like domain-containing protein [Bacteroidales bacterium]|nr:flippase-like domain-containing protein [Bacteroidales bacterium]